MSSKDPDFPQWITDLMHQEGLPEAYRDVVVRIVRPLASAIVTQRAQLGRPCLVGVNGAQGSGKSTLVLFLQAMLEKEHDCPTARFSLDDLYLTRSERRQLGLSVHPLLVTRGVPGTHDLSLGNQVLDQLSTATDSSETRIPAFDKSSDDRAPFSRWPLHTGSARVILLEGWCVGATPQPAEDLREPVNALEADEDPDGIWRSYVNDCLKTVYLPFFERLDWLIMLKAPGMDCVLKWRTLQERKLAQKVDSAPDEGINAAPDPDAEATRAAGEPPKGIMSDSDLLRFIQHYERLTTWMLRTLPGQADAVIPLDQDHAMGDIAWHTR